MFHHDLTHTGYSTSTAPTTNHTLWTYTTGGLVDSSPAIVNGIVYVGGGVYSYSYYGLYALNAATGVLVWNYTTGWGGLDSPAVANGIVYVGGCHHFYALNATTGAQVWNYTPGGYNTFFISSPAVANGLVYVGSDTSGSTSYNNVYALNATTGTLVWKYNTGSPVYYSSPAVANGMVYVGVYYEGSGYSVYALNAATGGFVWGYLVWNYNTGFPVSSSPAVVNGLVYVGSIDGNVYALSAASGTLVWNHTIGGPNTGQVWSSPAVVNGLVYVGSIDDNVYALNAATGALVWKYATGRAVAFSSPAVANGVVYVGSEDDNVYALNAATGALVWKYKTGNWVWSSPAVANGVVYVGSEDDKVYAFGQIHYSVSFTESRLPLGTAWWVDLNGNNQSSTSGVISFSEPNGMYTYSTGASGYIASPSSGSVTVNGANVSQTIQFVPSEFVALLTPAINGLQVDFYGGASLGSQVAYIQWSWGDGSTDTGWFPHAHTYTSSGTYQVTVTAYYNDGSFASASATVSVAPGIQSGGDSLTITAGAGGSVSYVASVGSGTVPSGSSTTLYLAFADDLSLSVNPNSGYSFQSWTATSGITGFGGSPVATTSPEISIVVIGDSKIAANFASAQTNSLSVNIEQSPAIIRNAVPFSMTFTGVASGGTAPYSISWTITSALGNSYVTCNPFTYTFKYAGVYTVSVTVTDSKSNTATDSIEIEAIGGSYLATFLASAGDATLSGTPSITLEENNQLGQGIIALGSSNFSLETQVKINWGGILLPSLVASFLGFSYPWYTILVTDEFGYSFQVPSPIQLSFSDTTSITANFPLYQQLDNLVPPGVSTLYTFTANPTTSQALSMDLISAVFALIHIVIPGNSVLENLLVGVASNLAESMTTDVVRKLVSGDPTQVAQVLPGILKEMENDLNLAASIAGTLAETLADGANAAASLAASLGDFLNDVINLTAVLIKGNLWDDYILTSATLLLSVVVDPNETLNAILSTPQGEIGYANGVWENTGNLTGFVHSDITNNTYGFAIPISDEDYNANLTISSPNGEAIPFGVVVKWENQTIELNGTVHGQEQNSFPITISGTNLRTHAIAVTNVVPSKTVVGQGYGDAINVEVANQGSYTETFNVTLYANTTRIASQNVTLTSGNSTTITFTWNTAGFAYGSYTISANVTLAMGETNSWTVPFTYGTVKVTIPGDINGDGTVNWEDLGILGLAYNSTPLSANWNPNADINGDGTVNWQDLGILGLNYNKSW
jgi:outer membrane protein assembly factor BamB